MADSAITFTSSEVSTYYAARVPHLKQRRAAQWRGACPIHHGKDENFAVKPDTGRWICHSTCGRKGDILDTRSGSDRRGLPDPEGRSLPARGTERTRIPAQRHPHEWKSGGHNTYKNYEIHEHSGRVAGKGELPVCGPGREPSLRGYPLPEAGR